MKPVVVYIDDEPRNHVAFEGILSEDWDIHCFDQPLEAIDFISKHEPWVVVSDQRMPKKSGNEVLEITKQLRPDAIRIITTGYSDEQLVIDSIRTAQVNDYIIKPWEPDDFSLRIERWVELYKTNRENARLQSELMEREAELKERNQKLISATYELERSLKEQESLNLELQSWVHPFVLKAKNEKIIFPIERDLGLLVIDIVNSGQLHGIVVDSQNLREKVLQSLWEIVLKHGGEIESQEGDKAYANFGLIDSSASPYRGAYAAATEFRSALQAINDHYATEVECGVALHIAKSCLISLRQTVMNLPSGVVVRKKFDTCSPDVDLVHRLESASHFLSGTNIIMSRNFSERLNDSQRKELLPLGCHLFKGQVEPVEIMLLKSKWVTEDALTKFISMLERQTRALHAEFAGKSA